MKFLLLPFSWLYGFITYLRNQLYDAGIFSTYHSAKTSIIIGNLQVGGAGKTPMTAFLYKQLSEKYKVAILSRGYGRKSKGLIQANNNSTPVDIGDEPVWYFRNLKAPLVYVSESRKLGLQEIEKTDTDLVLLDDAYQHRAIKGTVEIMLSDFALPYYNDYPMPYGRLREYRTSDQRADFIIISKCPNDLSLLRKVDIINRINPTENQHVFFTGLQAGTLRPLKGIQAFTSEKVNHVYAVSGIAKPESFINLCESIYPSIEAISFKDHHDYSKRDIETIISRLERGQVVITTEKDAVKLQSTGLYELIPDDTFFVLPIEVDFLFGEEDKFMQALKLLLKKQN